MRRPIARIIVDGYPDSRPIDFLQQYGLLIGTRCCGKILIGIDIDQCLSGRLIALKWWPPQ